MDVTCNMLMGHLAVPARFGVLTYLPIHCNRPAGHNTPKHCKYADPKSGMVVLADETPQTTVDSRGCVVEGEPWT